MAAAEALLAASVGGMHDARMPIRMKEWGLKAYPGQSVQVPLSGIAGMGEAARSFGRSLMAAGESGQRMMEMHERVVARGESAALKESLQNAAEQVKQKMLEDPPAQGWEGLWQQEMMPVADALLEKVPEHRRGEAVRVTQETLQRAALDFRRQYEVNRLNGARRQWQESVDRAVKQGNTKEAVSRLEEGLGIFVPEGEMESRRREVRSSCRSAMWRTQLQDDPVGTLTAWRAEDAERPEQEADVRSLNEEMAEAGIALRHQLGEEFSQNLLQGLPPAPEAVAGAEAAGLLEKRRETLKPRSLSAREEAEWMRRADECEPDADSLTALRLQLATLSAPVTQRRRLMAYLEQGRSLPQEERRELSSELWNLYRKGSFGCAGDSVPQQRLCRLLNESRRLLAEGNAEATSAWLNSLRSKETPWLCFES